MKPRYLIEVIRLTYDPQYAYEKAKAMVLAAFPDAPESDLPMLRQMALSGFMLNRQQFALIGWQYQDTVEFVNLFEDILNKENQIDFRQYAMIQDVLGKVAMIAYEHVKKDISRIVTDFPHWFRNTYLKPLVNGVW